MVRQTDRQGDSRLRCTRTSLSRPASLNSASRSAITCFSPGLKRTIRVAGISAMLVISRDSYDVATRQLGWLSYRPAAPRLRLDNQIEMRRESLSCVETEAGIRHGKKAISGHMLRHENFRLSANVLQLPEGDY